MTLDNIAAFVRQHDPAYAVVDADRVVLFLPWTRITPEGLRAIGFDVVPVRTFHEARRELGY